MHLATSDGTPTEIAGIVGEGPVPAAQTGAGGQCRDGTAVGTGPLEVEIQKSSTRPRDGGTPGNMRISTERPEFEPDQIAQAVSVGLCLVLAAVLLALAGVVQAWS